MVCTVNSSYGEYSFVSKGGTIKDNIRIYAILLVVLLLRYLVSGYNYAEIETNQVKAGMILSVATVLEFQNPE